MGSKAVGRVRTDCLVVILIRQGYSVPLPTRYRTVILT